MASRHSRPQDPPKFPPQEPPKSHRRIALIAAVGALSLAVLALAGILVLSNSHPSAKRTPASAIYQQKLSTALAPLVTANQTLSSALEGIDGSPHSITVAQSATTQTQEALSAVRGAVAILPVPASQAGLQQQTQQALTQENGYLQGVSSTLSDPIGQSASALRTLATNTQTAFVSIASVAPGASTSITGTDNLLNWVAGAQAAAKPKPEIKIINNNTTTTTTVVQPYQGPYYAPPYGLAVQCGNIFASAGTGLAGASSSASSSSSFKVKNQINRHTCHTVTTVTRRSKNPCYAGTLFRRHKKAPIVQLSQTVTEPSLNRHQRCYSATWRMQMMRELPVLRLQTSMPSSRRVLRMRSRALLIPSGVCGQLRNRDTSRPAVSANKHARSSNV